MEDIKVYTVGSGVHARRDEKVSGRGRTRAEEPGGQGDPVGRTWADPRTFSSFLPF
jgi:hypothetical protein